MIWTWLKALPVGLKWIAIAIVALVVGFTSWKTIQYFQQAEEGKITIQLQEKQIEKSKQISEAIKNAPSEVEEALDYLRNR